MPHLYNTRARRSPLVALAHLLAAALVREHHARDERRRRRHGTVRVAHARERCQRRVGGVRGGAAHRDGQAYNGHAVLHRLVAI